MAAGVSVALPDLLRRAVLRAALEVLRMLALAGGRTGVALDVAVALADLLRRAVLPATATQEENSGWAH